MKKIRDGSPNPHTYQNSSDIFIKNARKDGAFSMPKAERKFHFTKFLAQNNAIVEKGLL